MVIPAAIKLLLIDSCPFTFVRKCSITSHFGFFGDSLLKVDCEAEEAPILPDVVDGGAVNDVANTFDANCNSND